jgi:hypothetical protein
MEQRQHRMAKHHFRTRMAHDDLYLFPHVGFITVDGAFRAGRFVFLKRAFFKTHCRIIKQLPAVGAEITRPHVVEVMTVHTDHGLDCLCLSFDSGIFIHTMSTLKLKLNADSYQLLHAISSIGRTNARIPSPG